MKFLITGFEPFGESPLNPSQRLVDSLPDGLFDDVLINKAILPVDQIKGPQTLLQAIHDCQPEVILAFGLATGRARISLERITVNLMDYRIPDNAGNLVCDQPIIANGPAAYFSTLPLRDMLNALQREGIPVELSLSAGAYLCNQVFYTMMHEIATRNLAIRAGFIHLPALPEQAAESDKSVPSLSLDILQQAVEIMIKQFKVSPQVFGES
jgi:pyroglutamyl-peptidase